MSNRSGTKARQVHFHPIRLLFVRQTKSLAVAANDRFPPILLKKSLLRRDAFSDSFVFMQMGGFRDDGNTNGSSTALL